MGTFLLISMGLGGASLLCALLIISAARVASRSTKRIAGKEIADLAEEAQALQQLNTPIDQQDKLKSTHMALP